MSHYEFFLRILLVTIVGGGLFLGFGYSLSRILKRNDVADPLWGLGFISVALLHLILNRDNFTLRGVVIVGFVLLWGLRLSAHLFLRIKQNPIEDPRYSAMRKSWGAKEPLNALVKVFGLQGILMGLIAMPIGFVIQAEASIMGPFDFVGLTLFAVGFLIEAVADAQLVQFKKSHKRSGEVLRDGLWGLCRHPNYLGEILIWWGIYAVACAVPLGAFTIFSPILITWLLLRISGVPLLEKRMKERGAEFEHYILSTPAIVPIRFRDMTGFAIAILVLMTLDFLWLGLIMGDFYRGHADQVLRLKSGAMDPIFWAAFGVYFFLALGLRVFAVRPQRFDSLLRGGFLGLCIYGVYDLTNLSLLKNWSVNLSLIDMAWGTVLCSLASAAASVFVYPKEKA